MPGKGGARRSGMLIGVATADAVSGDRVTRTRAFVAPGCGPVSSMEANGHSSSPGFLLMLLPMQAVGHGRRSQAIRRSSPCSRAIEP